MKKIYSTLITSLFCVNAFTQSGNNCNNAIPVTPTATCTPTSHSTTDSLLYFSFTATSPDIQITVVSSIARCVAGGHPHQLTLFGGTCAALQTIEDESMPDIAGCTELTIDASNLTTGSTYYIRVSRGDIVDSNCVAARVTGAICFASQPLSFQLCVRSLNIIIPKDFGLEPASISHSYYTNKGQIVDVNQTPRFDINNYTNNSSPAIYYTDTAVSFVFAKIDTAASVIDTSHRVDMTLVGANTTSRPFKTEKINSNLNYFLAHVPTGATNIKGYSRTVNTEVYPNIDMQYYSNNVGVKFYFIVNPGGNADNIILNFAGATSVNVTASKGLKIKTTLGDIDFEAGHAYQINPAGNIVPMPWQAEFIQLSPTSVKFDIRNYPANFPLFIQVDRGHKFPTSNLAIDNLEHCTYYEGINDDYFIDVTTDTSGNVFATGFTTSANFPITVGSYQGFNAGSRDAIIVKFDNAMNRIYATYIGGTDDDITRGIALDTAGNILIIGTTPSSNFPKVNPGGGAYFDNTLGGTQDMFVSKIIPNPILGPQQLAWSTYIGGSPVETGYDLNFDHLGNLYIGGQAAPGTTPIQSPAGAFNSSGAGTYSAYIAKFNKKDSLLWGTLIPRTVRISSLGADLFNHIFVTGYIFETGMPIVNPGGVAYVDSFANPGDAFIMEFDNNDTIVWSSCFGGAFTDIGSALVVDHSNNIYICGHATTSSSFPIVFPGGNAYIDSIEPSNCTAFIAEFSKSRALKWSTYHGGDAQCDDGFGLAVDLNNNIYMTGNTNATDFPMFPLFSAYYQTPSFVSTISSDAYLAVFNSNNEKVWSTALGGANNDNGFALAAFKNSKLYMVGNTVSLPNTFPLVDLGSGAWFQDSLNGNNISNSGDAFISRFDLSPVIMAGVNENPSLSGGTIIYPNPGNGNVTVQISLQEKTNLDIFIFNSIGQVIEKVSLKNQYGTVKYPLNISSMPAGIYFVQVVTAQGMFSGKIIKQ